MKIVSNGSIGYGDYMFIWLYDHLCKQNFLPKYSKIILQASLPGALSWQEQKEEPIRRAVEKWSSEVEHDFDQLIDDYPISCLRNPMKIWWIWRALRWSFFAGNAYYFSSLANFDLRDAMKEVKQTIACGAQM